MQGFNYKTCANAITPIVDKGEKLEKCNLSLPKKIKKHHKYFFFM